jgi:hypothetical protein
LGEVSGIDSGKESGTFSGNNPGMRLGKKSSQELPDWVRRLGKRKTCKTRGHQVYRRPNQQGDKVESESKKKGQSELKEEI